MTRHWIWRAIEMWILKSHYINVGRWRTCVLGLEQRMIFIGRLDSDRYDVDFWMGYEKNLVVTRILVDEGSLQDGGAVSWRCDWWRRPRKNLVSSKNIFHPEGVNVDICKKKQKTVHLCRDNMEVQCVKSSGLLSCCTNLYQWYVFV